MKRALISIVAMVLLAKHGFSQEERVTHYMTLSPAVLIKLLPPAPKEWKVTSAMASNQMAEWLLAIAQKSMEYTPPPTTPKQGQVAPPPVTMKTSMTLTDSGGEVSSNGQFENFKPGVVGNQESVIINGCPTVITKESDIREVLVSHISNRFLFMLIAENQPAGTAKKWGSMLDTTKLTAIARGSTPITKLPNQVQIELVDELNPQNNRQHPQDVSRGPRKRDKGEQ